MLSKLINKEKLNKKEKTDKKLPQKAQKSSVWASNISATYTGHKKVLKNINLNLPQNKLILVCGPNGAGKSTLFFLLTGQKKPLEGQLRIFGNTVSFQCRNNNIAYMPQQENIDPDYPIKVKEVILGGRYGHMKQEKGIRKYYPPGLTAKKHQDIALKALKTVGLTKQQQKPLSNLSGGQKRRVFLARVLAQKARLLLLDEPLVGIDKKSEKVILNVLNNIKKQGQTILMITHNPYKLVNFADFIIVLNQTLIAYGKPEEILEKELKHNVNKPLFTIDS